ncbi:hypothetical protein D3C75_796630 [compost metagenome]
MLEDLGGHLAVGASADHQDGVASVLQLLDGGFDRFVLGQWATMQAWRNRQRVCVLGGNVFRKLQVHRARLLFLSQSEGFAHTGRDVVGRGELMSVLGDGVHHAAYVDDLKSALLGLLDRLLTGDHHHRHAAQVGVRTGGYQVGCAGAQGRQADAGLAGQPAIGSSHEARGLLVAGQYQLDLRLTQGFQQIEVFLARNAEHILDTFVLQALHNNIGGLSHSSSSSHSRQLETINEAQQQVRHFTHRPSIVDLGNSVQSAWSHEASIAIGSK